MTDLPRRTIAAASLYDSNAALRFCRSMKTMPIFRAARPKTGSFESSIFAMKV
jgi:hypothetical protein